MFIERCISAILAAAMFVESCLMCMPVQYNTEQNDFAPTISTEVMDNTSENESIIESEPVIEAIDNETTITETEVPSEEQISDSNTYGLTEDEIDLIALVTMAEAEGESEQGKRAVIDVILNRYESSRFPNTIKGVIYGKNAFECMQNGRVDRCYVREDIRQLVIEELTNRSYSNIHYFRANHYHSFGTPVVNIGNHYFSTY